MSGPASASFDEEWYLGMYDDVAGAVRSGVIASAYDHWLETGRAEGRVAPPGFLDGAAFDEKAYLLANPDVAEGVRRGDFGSGREHYLANGSREGRPTGMGAVVDEHARGVGLFDEAWYLKRNRDIAAAVEKGTIASGYAHWVVDGRLEGRKAPPGYNESLTFDEEFYGRAYPQAVAEVAAGRALTLRQHYETLGRPRGYVPNAFAERPGDPAAMATRSGLWLDHANALDLIEGRWELGQLTQEQAELLIHWARFGYVVLPRRLPAALADAAATAVHSAFDGDMDGARFRCAGLSAYHTVPWDPAVQTEEATALDLHWLAPPVLDLLLAPPIRSMLELLFGRRVMVAGSEASVRGAQQAWHRDTPTTPFSLGQSAAAFVALEDFSPGAGEFTYFPGSHKLPDHLYGGRYRTLWDAHRMLQHEAIHDTRDEDSERLDDQCRLAGLAPQLFAGRKGDVLLYHPGLVHGELAPDSGTRAAIVAHYCPREVAPLTFEQGDPAIRSHAGVASYATGVYGAP